MSFIKLIKNVHIAAFAVILFAITAQAGNVMAQATCGDGTEIPASVFAGGREDEFCQNKGGQTSQAGAACADGTSIPTSVIAGGREEEFCQNKNGVSTSPQSPGPSSNPNYRNDCKDANLTKDNCGIIAFLLDVINLLTAIAGIVITIMIAWGGIQYSAARDNPQAAQNAKNVIRNALLALLGFMFFYAFLQYVVPGGIL